MEKNTCCFFGHRKIDITNEVKRKMYNIIKNLIVEENIDTFLFGSKSRFNDLCYEITSKLKEQYIHIKRVYVRAEFPDINSNYKTYLLTKYEETYYPDNIIKAGRSAYIKRNYEMINKSKYCIIYFDEKYMLLQKDRKNMGLVDCKPKSGTKIAYDYAKNKQKIIINIFNEAKST